MKNTIALVMMAGAVMLVGCAGNTSPEDQGPGLDKGEALHRDVRDSAQKPRVVEAIPPDEASVSNERNAESKQGGPSAPAVRPNTVVYFNSTSDVRSHYSPDASVGSRAGILHAGRNYYYCWTEGEEVIDNGRDSIWWLRTDDDSGHTNVYVTDIYLDQDGWDNDLSRLPHC